MFYVYKFITFVSLTLVASFISFCGGVIFAEWVRSETSKDNKAPNVPRPRTAS